MAIEFLADAYTEGVLAGRVVACRQVVDACRRHVRDLDDGHERGLWFDEPAAKRAVAFFSVLRHWKGEWAGQAITLEPWQQFVVWSLFGWKRADGTRRFRTAYLEVARKNGKTTLAAGIGLYLLVADGEPGAEVYTAATMREQAKIAHNDAIEMVKRSPQLLREIGVLRENLHHRGSSSKFQPLSADHNTLDGLNIHGVIADEVHAWPNRRLWDVLSTATGARRQPLMLAITTAGVDRQSLCFLLHDYAEKVNSGAVDDDSFFGAVYSLDPEDDWRDEAVWQKANPNLGISKKPDDIRQQARQAGEMPAALNGFLRLHLNVWTQAETRWLSREAWDACNGVVDAEALRGRLCYGGLDLASTRDLSAWVLVFPPDGAPGTADGLYRVLCRFFVPEDNMLERERRDRVPYSAWVRGGYVTATPGNVIDYDWILAQIDEDARAFDVREIAFDRWGATRIQTALMERGGEKWLVEFGQGFASMSGPSKELERLILERKLAHGGHPVLTWMADNVVVREDPAGNIKPDKEKSSEKIDGIVALVMGLARAMAHMQSGVSVYERRGLVAL